MTDIAEKIDQPVARPLKVLEKLIHEDLSKARQAGEAAASAAAEPYYRAAGEKMIEAKAYLSQGDFEPWIRAKFKISPRHARRYMGFARATANIDFGRARPQSFSEYMREEGGDAGYGRVVRKKEWHDPVKEALQSVNLGRLAQESLKRGEEQRLQTQLALKLIDIGYKALATKLHPDKGGSREAMSRLNAVRTRLKQFAERGR
jgi:hypothetical protein